MLMNMENHLIADVKGKLNGSAKNSLEQHLIASIDRKLEENIEKEGQILT